ncbi:C40 family peptidase [Archangium violaceum]|uniref:C40 family peptidase n=1 Tax=Archangium violaceum TaxID=83451 RepID=UPI00195058A0|nr:C40 family peptidase [Archangium violaceum]QRN94425.1 C40 family peptidase [Archangium violaceum]
MPRALPLLIASLQLVPVSARALGREEVMAEAARFAQHPWEMRAANQKGTCPGEYRSDHALGKQIGVPYAWGGSMELAEFDRRIGAGQAAGSHSGDGILTCVAGVDCSGFVSRVWRLAKRESTSTLGTVTRPITLEELLPGDALNKAGKHVVLFAGTRADGKPIIYEASGSASRVRMATPSWSYLAGYVPIRYPGIEDKPVVASVPPAPAPVAPASDASAPPPPPAATAPQVVLASATTPAGGPVTTRLSLRYGADVGFTPASEDAQSMGPDYLTAGPKGTVALYDRVRRRVLVLGREGMRGSFDAGLADGLGFTRQGELIVMDGTRHQLRLHRSSGELLRTVDIPREGLLGALTLDDGVLLATSPEGEQKVIAELVNGKPQRPRKNVDLSQQQVLRWKERAGGGRIAEVGGESLTLPEKARVSARRVGTWIELVIATSDAGGSHLEVKRTLRRRGQVVNLPDATRGAYTPIADLAVDPDGAIVYLEPGAQGVSLTWLDAG